MSPDDPRHGTTAGHYAHRKDGETACLPCVAAKTRYEKVRSVYGNRMVPALGTRRRIQALKTLGHSGADIGARLGVTYQAVHKLENSTATHVFAATAVSVARAYEEMCMTQPTGYHATRIRNQAARNGYAPPLAWDCIDTDLAPNLGGVDDQPDPVVVARILGHDASLARTATPAERRAVVAAWPGSLNDLERLTGWRADRYIDREEGAA